MKNKENDVSDFKECPCYEPQRGSSNERHEEIMGWALAHAKLIERELDLSADAFSDIATLFCTMEVEGDFHGREEECHVWGTRWGESDHNLHIPGYDNCQFSHRLLRELRAADDILEFTRGIVLEAVSQKIRGSNE